MQHEPELYMPNGQPYLSNAQSVQHARVLTQVELKEVTDFFDNIYYDAPQEKSHRIFEWIFKMYLGVQQFDVECLEKNCKIIPGAVVVFHDYTDIFTAMFYYKFIEFYNAELNDNNNEVFLLKPVFINNDKINQNFYCFFEKIFRVTRSYYDSSTITTQSDQVPVKFSEFFTILWEFSKFSTKNVKTIRNDILSKSTCPSQYFDSSKFLENFLDINGFYSKTQEVEKIVGMGYNPYELHKILFKIPKDVDDLTKILFMKWHYGYAGYDEQMSILDQVLTLPDKCKTILQHVYEDIAFERYAFELDGD